MNLYVVFFAIAFSSGVFAVALEPEFHDTNRITNGITAAENQFPYVVSIQNSALSTTATRGHLCGGVLFTLQHVLTTASCLHQGSNSVLPVNQTRIFAGATLLTNDTANNVRSIQDITIHPQYTGAPAFAFDIAVITLAAPFWANVTSPIALPAADYNPTDFTSCQTAGWGGNNTNNAPSSNLKYANKYIYNHMLCTLSYNLDEQSPNVLDNVICATSYDMMTSGCPNDIGNPLVCDSILTGLLSVTRNCLPSSRPELYTRVANYTTWIRSISSAPTLLPGVFVVVMAAVQLLLTKISN